MPSRLSHKKAHIRMTSRLKDMNGVSAKKRAQDVSCHVAPGASAKNFPRARVEGTVQLATHVSEPLYDTRPVTVKRYAMFDKILQTLSICSVLAVVVLVKLDQTLQAMFRVVETVVLDNQSQDLNIH